MRPKLMPSSVAHEIDTYMDTVWALLAFTHELTWDDATKKVLAQNKYAVRHTEEIKLGDGSKITPDIHIRVPNGLPIAT